MDLDVASSLPRITCQENDLLTYGPFWSTSTGNCSIYTTTLLKRAYPTKATHKSSEYADFLSSSIPYTPLIEDIEASIICTE